MKSDVALALLFGLCSSPCIRAASHRHRPWRPVAGYAHPRRAVGDATQPKELLALSCPQGPSKLSSTGFVTTSWSVCGRAAGPMFRMP